MTLIISDPDYRLSVLISRPPPDAQEDAQEVKLFSVWSFQVERSAYYFEADELGRNKLPVQAGCGVMSGLLSAVLTNTLDVIRTRIQVQQPRFSLKLEQLPGLDNLIVLNCITDFLKAVN